MDAPMPIDTFQIESADAIIGGIAPPDTFWNDTPFKTLYMKNIIFKFQGMFLNVLNRLLYNSHRYELQVQDRKTKKNKIC